MNIFLKKNNFVIISIGAIPASILRWQIDQIFIVNIIGCFCIGVCMALIDTKSNFSFLIVTGFLGSFTTMSALSSQTIELMITEKYLIGIIYSVGTVISCVIATFIAYNIFKT